MAARRTGNVTARQAQLARARNRVAQKATIIKLETQIATLREKLRNERSRYKGM